MRSTILRRAALGTAATFLATGAVVGASGTSIAAPSHDTSVATVTSDNRGGDRHDCNGHGSYPHGGYYGLGLLSWIL